MLASTAMLRIKRATRRLQSSVEEHSRMYRGPEHKELVRLVLKPRQDVKEVVLV